jgi:hypothetical protein
LITQRNQKAKLYYFIFIFKERLHINITPLKAIRQHCLQCGDGTPKDVSTCPITDCYLWHYRFGMSLETYEKRKKYAKNYALKKGQTA